MLSIAESYCSHDAADGPRLILFRLPPPQQLHRQVPKKATADSFEATDSDEQDAFKRRTGTSVPQRRITEYEAVGSVGIEKDRPVGQKAAEAEVQIIQRRSAKKTERR